MKKSIFITLFLVLILVANMSFASYSTVTMSVVEEPVCTIEIGENSKFEKRLIEKNLNNKEVTLQLQVSNEEISTKPTGELMLVIDNSDSMTEETSTGEIRENLVINSAKTLINNLSKDNENLKIGAVSFSSSLVPQLSRTSYTEGTLDDANLVSELTNNEDDLISKISNIEYNGPRTDLDAGITLASQYFTEEANNKYMIVLTDGVPNIALNYDGNYFSDDCISKTNASLKKIESAGIQLITMLTGIDNPDEKPMPGIEKTYAQIIQEVFGTEESPTAGKFYYIQDSEIEQTITNDIYNDLLPIEKTLTNIKIVDYFPQEIIDNFEFAYVSNANIGEISAEVDKTNNSITWTIPELKSGETATVQYKLKLKENFDSNIVDKILDTNEKVDVTYDDFDGNPVNKTSDVTPKLKLTEPPAVLPKAGTPIMIALFTIVVGLLVYSFMKLTVLDKNMKH